jgi:hypothetical protein
MGIFKFFKEIFSKDKKVDKEATKDKLYQSENSYDKVELAVKAFRRSKGKLFNVNNWSKLGGPTATFELHKNNGIPVKSKKPRKGDFIRIELPGPTPENWVKVIKVSENDNMASFVVSPSEDPREKDGEVEHFFIKEATSEFKVELKGSTIKAYEIGKNEGINNTGYEAGKRELINTLLAEGGWAGFQEFQWKKVTDYLVHKEELEKNEDKDNGN